MGHRHNVFISYHHQNDEYYRDQFEQIFSSDYNILISKSVQMGDIGSNLRTETIRQKIRDEYLRDSTVTVVLIGLETWKRKHVDWEISSSIRDTRLNPRSGLMGILLPTHPDYGEPNYTQGIIPPRLSDNIERGFAELYDWSTDPHTVQDWIHDAFLRRNQKDPNNAELMFINNRSADSWC